MILKDTFYTIQDLQFEQDSLNAKININPEHPVFKGHFPGNPVTPGVLQLECIKELLAVHLDKEVHLADMANCKFMAVLNPEENPSVNINLKITKPEDATENHIQVTGQILNENQVFLKMKAQYRVGE